MGEHAADAEPVAATRSAAATEAGALAGVAGEAPGGPQATVIVRVMSQSVHELFSLLDKRYVERYAIYRTISRYIFYLDKTPALVVLFKAV
jgi:hypothetical protein